MLHVENLTSPRSGREVPNQFRIRDGANSVTFQSYNSMIVTVNFQDNSIIFGEDWNYSVTTGKYRNQFFRELSSYFDGLTSREGIENAINEGKYLGFSVALV